MAKVKMVNSTSTTRKRRPALTPEAREKQLVSYAYDLVEQRLLDGTASSQETTYFLKLGSEKSRLENEKLKEENKMLKAKTENLESQTRNEELVKQAIEAFRRYSGAAPDEDDYDDPDIF